MLNPREKIVALTLDDGPQETNDILLDILKERNVRATFFMIGENIEKRPEIVKRAYAEGHDIAWHSYEHKLTAFSTKEYIEADLKKGIELIEKVTGERPKYFRAPGGHISEDICITAANYGYRQVEWSNYSFIDKDEQGIPAKERADATFDAMYGIRSGDILLAHPRDNMEILEGLGLMIDRFHAEGYKVLSLTELFESRSDGIVICYGPLF